MLADNTLNNHDGQGPHWAEKAVETAGQGPHWAEKAVETAGQGPHCAEKAVETAARSRRERWTPLSPADSGGTH